MEKTETSKPNIFSVQVIYNKFYRNRKPLMRSFDFCKIPYIPVYSLEFIDNLNFKDIDKYVVNRHGT